MYLCLSIKVCLSNSLQIETNLFLTPVFPAHLVAISIFNLSTSAIGSRGKTMVGIEGVIPFPVYRSFSQIGFNMCFHFQFLLVFGLVSLSSGDCWMHYFSIIIIIPIGEILSSGVVATISSHSPGVPSYSLSPTIILFSFVFASLFPM